MKHLDLTFLYFIIPTAVWYYDIPIIPALLVASTLALYGLRHHDYDFAQLLELPEQHDVLDTLLTFGAVALLVVATSLLLAEPIGRIWKISPWLGIAFTILYPLLSVVPQTILYRVLYEQRYAHGTFIGAVAFSYGHIVMQNIPALVLTFIGGWVFLRRYQETQNFVLSVLEHSLYGLLIFNTALGPLFVS